ncbi:MAG: type II secretion system GspH family protein [Clostridium sp.]|nr:type II secretion system GspH family protein [Clostridium sp.]
MKKTNNKGFSLVELIIVIAIMAILAGAIAPALIRYIDKSRKSNDVSAAKTIKTAVETAMANEASYEYLTAGTADTNGNTGVITVTPGASQTGGVSIVVPSAAPTGLTATDKTNAEDEIAKNVGENMPKIKYKKAADGTNVPALWVVTCTSQGTIKVGLGTTGATTITYELVPEICSYYQ